MRIDAIACERQFLDHAAPVWLVLPESVRGTFHVAEGLQERARGLGIEPTVIDATALRRTPQQPARDHGRLCLVASIGDTKIGRRLGYGPFVRLEHGAGQGYRDDRSGSYAGSRGNEDAALVLVPNEYAATLWRRTYPGARVEVVGSPVLDRLPRREPGSGPVIAMSWHWPGPGYAGTAWGEYRGVLPDLMARYQVIGHQHPNWLQRSFAGPPSAWYAKLGIPFVEEFDDVCRQADVYVADNTSTLWEFASTGRPVVVVNSRAWSRQVQHGLRFWDAANVGVNVDKPADLVAAVERALEDPPEVQAAREAALDIVYAYRSGAAQRAAAAISAWLGGTLPKAAPTLVGEAGPELFIPSVAGVVIPHDLPRSA